MSERRSGPTETLTRIALRGGVYMGALWSRQPTAIEALHDGRVVAEARLTRAPGQDDTHHVALDLPASILTDGVQVIELRSAATGAVLDRIAILAGNDLTENLAAEVALLRAELDLLKDAFRAYARARNANDPVRTGDAPAPPEA